jgi:hypothetical protein
MRIPQTVRALNDDCYDELFDDEGQMARRLDGEHYCEKERSQTSELDPRTARCLALLALPLGDSHSHPRAHKAHRAPNAPNELLQHVSGARTTWTVLYRFGGGFAGGQFDGNSVPWTRLLISHFLSTNACWSIL